ncbi:endonuclease, partial [Pseudomonas sp. NZIPFR-PS5]
AHRPRLADLQPITAGPSSHATALRSSPQGRVTPASQLEGRSGYSDEFLGEFVVPWPTVSTPDDVYPLGNPGNRLDYTHFSISMSRSRRIALYVGVNIEGGSSVEIVRSQDAWAYDGRLPVEAQIGDDLYRDNLLDRGHLVRRQDPNWGAEAQTANQDTFHFTPRAFWKVVAFLGDDGTPSASAYLIDQTRELGKLELVFGALRTYRRSVVQIEQLTGISFGELARYDGFSNEEQLTGTRIEALIQRPEDIRL